MKYILTALVFLSVSLPASARDFVLPELLSRHSQVEASFVQTSEQGQREGTFWLSYPGKMRIAYDNSTIADNNVRGDEIVADGFMLHFYDAEMDYVSTVPLSQTPAGWMLSDAPEVADRITVVEKRELADGGTGVVLQDQEDPDLGAVTVWINPKGQLRGWRIVDALGVVTDIRLENIKNVEHFERGNFKAPNPDVKQDDLERNRR